MTMLIEFSPFIPPLFKTSDQGATRTDEAMGDHVRFTDGVGDGRSESRTLNGGTERWVPIGKLRAIVSRHRFHLDSEGRFAVPIQMKGLPDDTHPAGAPVTPTRAVDADRGQNQGRLVFIVRSDGNEPHYTLMTAADFVACQDRVIEILHVELLSKGADGYSRMAWRYQGETAFRNDVIHRGPNIRSLGASSGTGYTLSYGLYRGDTGDVDYHDLGMNPGPRVYDSEAEALAYMNAVAPPPPPDLPGDPCAGVKGQLATAIAERDDARAIGLELKGRIDRAKADLG